MLMSDGAGGSITVNSPSENRAVGSHLGAYMAPAPTISSGVSDAPVTDGLIIHLRADVLDLADGQNVIVWPDSATADSVDGTVYTFGNTGIPTFKDSACNGLPAVNFNDVYQQALMSEV